MVQRYILFRRHNGIYYAEDRETKKQQSLKTKDKQVATRLLHAKNEAVQQPQLSRQLAKTYFVAGDPEAARRTWDDVARNIIMTKNGGTKERWERAWANHSFEPIRGKRLIDTSAEDLIKVLQGGSVSTNVYLRRLHNFALDLQWLLAPILPRKQWPVIEFKQRRAITWEEHQLIVAIEPDPQVKIFYNLAWHFGASQSDLANLMAEDIDWINRVVVFGRKKTRHRNVAPVQISFNEQVACLIQKLPSQGLLFPRLAQMQEKHRALIFRRRCNRLKITGISLHSYRYAWAERAKLAGMPERFAMQALGHNSKAVHRAYAKKIEIRVPSLAEYESKIVKVPFSTSSTDYQQIGVQIPT